MFLESQYESYIEDIQDAFEEASKICEDGVSDLDSLAWDYDELLTQIEDEEDYDVDRVERLVEKFQNKIDEFANDAANVNEILDYYEIHREITGAVVEELRRSNYSNFADML